MTPAQNDLLANLGALRRAIADTTTLKSILDGSWFEAVERDIRRDSAPHALTADPSGFLYDFCHPLRDVNWFETAQKLLVEGRLDEISEDARFAFWFAGVDPLRTVIPLLESRLQALAGFAVKPVRVRMKLAELRAARSNPSFKNHLFELGVLGDLATKNALVDIEEPATGVDGVINIDGRAILVEATNTVQQVTPNFVGVFSTDPKDEIDQVVKKLRKKVAEGRQLALANGKATLLFMARTHLGAGRESAQIALRECFGAPDFAALSGVVLADSWKLFVTSWHPGTNPDLPFTDRESQKLAAWYGRE